MKYLPLFYIAMLVFGCGPRGTSPDEREHPTSFLNLTQDSWTIGAPRIEGTLSNAARTTDYANIVLVTQYLSSEGKKIGTERFVDYMILESGESRKYQFDVHPPLNTVSLVTIIDRAQYIDYESNSAR